MTGPPSAGVSSEIVTIFVMRGVRRMGRGGGVGGEKIRVHVIPKAQAAAWLEGMRGRGFWVDPKVYAGLWVLGCQSGGPGSVRAESEGRGRDETGTSFSCGRDGARPSRGGGSSLETAATADRSRA